MTADEINNLQAGREMDALVAERVMGWVKREKNGIWCTVHPEWGQTTTDWLIDNGEHAMFWKANFNCHGIWEPSSNIAAAWLVVEKMKADGFRLRLVDNENCGFDWEARFYKYPESIEIRWVQGKTAMESICKAALNARLVGRIEK